MSDGVRISWEPRDTLLDFSAGENPDVTIVNDHKQEGFSGRTPRHLFACDWQTSLRNSFAAIYLYHNLQIPQLARNVTSLVTLAANKQFHIQDSVKHPHRIRQLNTSKRSSWRQSWKNGELMMLLREESTSLAGCDQSVYL